LQGLWQDFLQTYASIAVAWLLVSRHKCT